MKKKLDIELVLDLNRYIAKRYKPRPETPPGSVSKDRAQTLPTPETTAVGVIESEEQTKPHNEASPEPYKKKSETGTEAPQVKDGSENAPKPEDGTAKKPREDNEISFSRKMKPYDPPVPVSRYHMDALSSRIQKAPLTFSEYLLHLIDQNNLTDSKVYKAAGIDRWHFSKIRSDKYYQPTKSTALQLAIALELPPKETNVLLGKAGYRLSATIKSDVIVSYFLKIGIYDLNLINSALYAFDEAPLTYSEI